jgi:hypothetical protein
MWVRISSDSPTRPESRHLYLRKFAVPGNAHNYKRIQPLSPVHRSRILSDMSSLAKNSRLGVSRVPPTTARFGNSWTFWVGIWSVSGCLMVSGGTDGHIDARTLSCRRSPTTSHVGQGFLVRALRIGAIATRQVPLALWPRQRLQRLRANSTTGAANQSRGSTREGRTGLQPLIPTNHL